MMREQRFAVKATCGVCFFHTWVVSSRSKFGDWVLFRCKDCTDLDANPLSDIDSIIDHSIPSWLQDELVYVQSPRSKGGIYVTVGSYL